MPEDSAVLIGQAALSESGSAAGTENAAFSANHAGVDRHGSQIADLQFKRRIAMPAGRLECTAQPIQESSSVAANPPCTDPIGL